MEKEVNEITLTLTNDEALVLFDFLSRFNEKEHNELFEDQSEEKTLRLIESQLEKILVEPFMPNYIDILKEARNKTRNKE